MTQTPSTSNSNQHRHVIFDKRHINRALFNDRLAKGIITSGGVTIIVTVIGILMLIISVSLPLFQRPESELIWRHKIPAETIAKQPIAIKVEEYREKAFILTASGDVDIFQISATSATYMRSESLRSGDEIQFVNPIGRNLYSLLWKSGDTTLINMFVVPNFDSEGKRSITAKVETIATVARKTADQPLRSYLRKNNDILVRIDVFPPSRIAIHLAAAEKEEDETTSGLLFGGTEPIEPRSLELNLPISGGMTAETLTANGSAFYVGSDQGDLVALRFDDEGSLLETIRPPKKLAAPISNLGLVFGDVSVVAGTTTGEQNVFFPRRLESGNLLQSYATFDRQSAPITGIYQSSRNKMIISLNEAGQVALDYLTSRKRVFTLSLDQPVKQVGYAPRGDALIGILSTSEVALWSLHAPHPEISWSTLFGQVWYENYPQEEYVWQSTGGSDEFESKMSLVPLIFGTIKSTFYAMIFAVPLAILGAIYISFFASPLFRSTIKPAIELMAALPSVVIGFLVALWLAPLFESAIVGVFATLVLVPIFFVVFMFCWQWIRHYNFAKRAERGYEFIILMPVTMCAVALATYLTPYLEVTLFDGSFAQWLYNEFGHRFDQRNSIVIAVGLGVAVIPIIFSISEDSLSSVPRELSSSSLALGASRWQTAWRIIVPSASPGIFAATMIGLGRAVGETMIVLMATGNTPIMDWSPFNGMRTLSANIAVEIPEAPVGGSLYRTLFLCSVILFTMTFFLNTAAEVIRHQLRKKYGRF